jgi:hypothetical protein
LGGVLIKRVMGVLGGVGWALDIGVTRNISIPNFDMRLSKAAITAHRYLTGNLFL